MSIIDQAAQNAANKRKAAELDKIDNKVAMDGLAYQAQRIAEANARYAAMQQEAAKINKEGMFSNNYTRPSTTNEYDVRGYINRGGSPTGTVDYGNDPDTQARLREFNANKQRYGSISEGIR